MTIVVEATKSESTSTDASAFDILCEVVEYIKAVLLIRFDATCDLYLSVELFGGHLNSAKFPAVMGVDFLPLQ